MILKRDEVSKAVCELLTIQGNGNCKVGTGLFVGSPAEGEDVFAWIVTANHVAKSTNDQMWCLEGLLKFILMILIIIAI